MLWGNTAYCVKLSGNGLSRYSNTDIFLNQPIQFYSNNATKLHLTSHAVSRVAPQHRDRMWSKIILWCLLLLTLRRTARCIDFLTTYNEQKSHHSRSHWPTLVQSHSTEVASDSTASDRNMKPIALTLAMNSDLYIGWSDVTYLWSQCDRYFVGQQVVLCVVKWCRFVALFE